MGDVYADSLGISTHAPARGATLSRVRAALVEAFQPTLPARGATVLLLCCCGLRRGISTHAPRTGSDIMANSSIDSSSISTHAPRTGSDCVCGICECVRHISTHAPRTGSDRAGAFVHAGRGQFQPTLPARGATRNNTMNSGRRKFQPTLPARGATPPNAECPAHERFQPTLPARGATLIAGRRLSD